jgi:peroxiredoxin|tara:strand:- start:16330 stop:16578 length:249 start_codon:yes stop_codon:yes gene_type:complete
MVSKYAQKIAMCPGGMQHLYEKLSLILHVIFLYILRFHTKLFCKTCLKKQLVFQANRRNFHDQKTNPWGIEEADQKGAERFF